MNQIVIGAQAASERPLFWNPCASGRDGLPEMRGGSSHSLPGRPIRVVIVLSSVFPKANWTKFKASLSVQCLESAARAAAGSVRSYGFETL
jgi:hypothetical protein